jgi:hypothetical protein
MPKSIQMRNSSYLFQEKHGSPEKKLFALSKSRWGMCAGLKKKQ